MASLDVRAVVQAHHGDTQPRFPYDRFLRGIRLYVRRRKFLGGLAWSARASLIIITLITRRSFSRTRTRTRDRKKTPSRPRSSSSSLTSLSTRGRRKISARRKFVNFLADKVGPAIVVIGVTSVSYHVCVTRARYVRDVMWKKSWPPRYGEKKPGEKGRKSDGAST